MFNVGEAVTLRDSVAHSPSVRRVRVHMVALDSYHTVCGQELDDYNANFFQHADKPVDCKRCLNNAKGY